MSEDLSLNELNAKLDDLSFKILKLMNGYIQSKLQLEQTLRNGCLDLAKARYLRGSHTISAVQLPTEDSVGVRALAKVESYSESSDDCLQFRLNCVEPPTPTKELKPKTKVEDYIIEEESTLETSEKLSNPLKWFGVLVPQNLRQAQTLFKRSIELAVDCANIQSDIENKRLKFLHLLKLKKMLDDTVAVSQHVL